MYLKTTEDVKLDQNMHVDINSNETLFYLFDVISSKCGESCKGLGVGGWGGGVFGPLFIKKCPFWPIMNATLNYMKKYALIRM